MRAISYYLLFFMMVPLAIMGNHSFDERIRNLKNISGKSLTDSVSDILYDLTLESKVTEMKFTHTLLMMDDILKEETYFLVMRHYAKIAPSNNQALIDSCLRFARNNNLGGYISSLYVLKSTFFNKVFIYDSAMIYTLRARDEAVKYGNIEQQANVLHLLGDLYFNTGLFPKARQYYAEVQEVKGSDEVWNAWRRRVIRNNLGQIEMNDGNYYKALGLFDESRKETGNQMNTKVDSLALAYIYLLRAQALFHLRDYQKTNATIDSSFAISEKTEDHTGLFNLYVLKARLSLITDNAKRAKEFIDHAGNFADAAAITQAERNEILLLRSNIYEALGEPHIAMAYLKSYAVANDSLFKELKFAQISQIQSENEYERFKIKYEEVKNERTVYFLFGIAAVIVISIISMLYLRIRGKNKRLVALAIDSAGSLKKPKITESGFAVKWEDKNNSYALDVNQQGLVSELSRLIESDKLYLQRDFSLQKAAELLGTNRTYLSKAINLELNQSFTVYINRFRIKEAINIISQRDFPKPHINNLAENVGFGSRTSFLSSFLKHTGMLPSTFVTNYKQLLREGGIDREDQEL